VNAIDAAPAAGHRQSAAHVWHPAGETATRLAQAGAKPSIERPKQYRIYALPERAALEIKFPRVERYAQRVRTGVTVDWPSAPQFELNHARIPAEVQMKAGVPTNTGRPSVYGPGAMDKLSLAKFRGEHREQEVAFTMAAALAREYEASPQCMVPPHALFPQLLRIVQKYLDEKVSVSADADLRDLMLAPWYGWVVERLREALRPDTREGDAPELPVYEKIRPDGSTADVEYWTRIEPYAVQRSHVNAVVAHSGWEKTAAYELDNHAKVEAFVKNAGLGFAIPYLLDGEPHDYVPDFIVRLKGGVHLILETKGFDPKLEVKRAAAERWVAAVNADGTKGQWKYALVDSAPGVRKALDEAT
jgi:type III restriction enzyme